MDTDISCKVTFKSSHGSKNYSTPSCHAKFKNCVFRLPAIITCDMNKEQLEQSRLSLVACMSSIVLDQFVHASFFYQLCLRPVHSSVGKRELLLS